jgi:hypothetical protein
MPQSAGPGPAAVVLTIALIMRYDLYRVIPPCGNVHYAFVADDERKDSMLEVQANGAPTEWVWSCEATTAEEAIQALDGLMEQSDWKP